MTASFQGRDGDLQMATGSVDQTQTYVFEVNPSQQADSASRTLCFWSIEGDNDSTITVWNYKATPQDLVLTLYYFHGQYVIPIHLGPLESYNLDMRSLVNSRVPDPSGALIPSNLTGETGSAVLSGKGGETDTISVAVSASVFNVRNATCNILCYQCNGATSVAFDPGSYAEAVGGTAQAQVQVTWNSGNVYTNPSQTIWSIGNSSIATVGSSGVIAGQSPGETGVSFYLDDYPMYAVSCSGYMPCPNGNPGGGGTDTVGPKVTVNTGASIQYGQSPNISATVSPNANPVPTGTVDFSMEPAGGTEPATEDLAEGAASWNLGEVGGGQLIPVGAYTVTAEYSGDDNYSEATGSATFAVQKAESQSKITTSCPLSVTAGQPASFNVSVGWANAPTATGAVEPTGQVTLVASPYSGNAIQASGTLSGQMGIPATATISITLPAGSYTVTAQYQGDANYITNISPQCVVTAH